MSYHGEHVDVLKNKDARKDVFTLKKRQAIKNMGDYNTHVDSVLPFEDDFCISWSCGYSLARPNKLTITFHGVQIFSMERKQLKNGEWEYTTLYNPMPNGCKASLNSILETVRCMSQGEREMQEKEMDMIGEQMEPEDKRHVMRTIKLWTCYYCRGPLGKEYYVNGPLKRCFNCMHGKNVSVGFKRK